MVFRSYSYYLRYLILCIFGIRHLDKRERRSFLYCPCRILLIVGILVAYFKTRQTNQGTFIPTIFFMTVLTIIEWVPALRINDPNWVYLMLVPLLICNTYQLLILHFFIEKSNKERKTKIKSWPNKVSSSVSVEKHTKYHTN